MSAAAKVRSDVVVVGGGPAGSTAAALLAAEGIDVVLVERARFPRFHIGESLLPHSMPILAKIGALDEVEAISVPKYGADFTTFGGRRQEITFDRALHQGPASAFQVKRAEFDAILLDAAERKGATILRETTVQTVDLADPDSVRIEAKDGSGERLYLEARQLVDASGRDGVLARKLDLRVLNKRHQSAAVFSHFTKVPRRPGAEGNISVYWHAHGWLWFIPQSGDQMSIGLVCTVEHFKSREVPLEQFLDDAIARTPAAALRMQMAERIAPVRAASNYSYQAERMSGPNYLMIGDAYAFIDPLFSTGVHFAMHAAAMASDVVAARLKEPHRARAALARMQRRIERGVADVSWLVHRFSKPTMRHLLIGPRDILGVERTIVSLLAGDVFGSPGLAWRYRLFKLIYGAHLLWFKLKGPAAMLDRALGSAPVRS